MHARLPCRLNVFPTPRGCLLQSRQHACHATRRKTVTLATDDSSLHVHITTKGTGQRQPASNNRLSSKWSVSTSALQTRQQRGCSTNEHITMPINISMTQNGHRKRQCGPHVCLVSMGVRAMQARNGGCRRPCDSQPRPWPTPLATASTLGKSEPHHRTDPVHRAQIRPRDLRRPRVQCVWLWPPARAPAAPLGPRQRPSSGTAAGSTVHSIWFFDVG